MQSVASIPRQRRNLYTNGLLLAGFAAAVGLRVFVGGSHVAQSFSAGLVFAICLIALSIVGGVHTTWSWRSVGIGIIGGIALCMPTFAAHLLAHRGWAATQGYLSWAIVVSIVASSEELFLRGALFDGLKKWRGNIFAVAVSAIAFALLHVPLYGWHVVPLDMGVGLFLGALRMMSGTWVAPGMAHVITDLAGWWIR